MSTKEIKEKFLSNMMGFVKGFWKVFSDWRYLFFGLVIALVFYSLNVLIFSWKTLLDFYYVSGFIGDFGLFFDLFFGFNKTIKLHGFISLVVISLLIGILFSMILWKTFYLKKQGGVGVLGSVGIFLGVLAPGCAACGIGILSLLGVSAAFLNFLPLEGLEISLISIMLLSFGVWQIGKKIEISYCKIRKV